jgi:uncharacterized protein
MALDNARIDGGSAALNRVVIRPMQKIAMRDGVSLNANVYLPFGARGAVPIVMQKTPYGIDAFHLIGRRFASQGLGFILVDCRGRGGSGGVFDMFDSDVDDLVDVLDWLEQQDWCDGQVAMHGGSYSGTNQWIAAKSRHPALKGIAPWGAAYPGIDVPPGGVPFVGHLSWHVLTAGHGTQWQTAADSGFWQSVLADAYRENADFAALAATLGADSPAFLKTIRDPFYAIKERHFLPTDAEMASIDIPVLSSTGFHDSTHGGTLYFHRQHQRLASDEARALHTLVIGPWHHAGMDGTRQVGDLRYGEAAGIDMGAVRIDWYRWLFGLGAWPDFLADRFVYYVGGAEEWRSAPKIADATGHDANWFLHNGGTGNGKSSNGGLLSPEPSTGTDHFTSDPLDGEIIEVELSRRNLARAEKKESAVVYPDAVSGLHLQIAGEDPTDDAFASNLRGQGLVYLSAELDADVEIAGIPALDMTLSLSEPDADIVALLSEVWPEGERSVLLWSNILRLRYRNGWDRPVLAQPGEAFDARFFIPRFVARRLSKGNRLRLVLRAPASIHFQKNLHSGKPPAEERREDARTCRVTIHHHGETQTVLRLPIAGVHHV